ncbi:AGC family protein kinase [Tritrichomonas foetus]|uniref:non-specific serine/threonine protein kinase n=1 Tax=Tritrichomonas foetus TaxID=1144522 RepID=A0A1J4KAT0_9EUKA|nr:AGC family protein kinase [Tritrichomonas foetus]|eukprot:OHT06812.1 AGC family protein kinase [Tritrichomonas foetus]
MIKTVNHLPGFTIIKQLGQGSYGTVYKVKRQSDNQNYALKVVDLSQLNQHQREDSVNEIRIMASVVSPFIIGFHEATIQDRRLFIVTEYAKLGDLSKAINRRKMKRRPFKEDTIWRFLLQALEGLRVLHERGIVHRDLKSANILLSAPDLFKIGDLGISTVLQQRQLAKTQIGTPMYLAPEIWKKKPYNSKCDIWSLGVLLYEMATFSYPYNARNARDLSVKVCSTKAPHISNIYSRELANVIQTMLIHNPVQRPSVEAILAMPAIQKRMCLIKPFLAAVQHSEANLLQTIKVPRNLQLVNLPPSRYDNDVENDCLPLEQRVFLKGKLAEQTRVDLASTRELLMIADLDCWTPTKPTRDARLQLRNDDNDMMSIHNRAQSVDRKLSHKSQKKNYIKSKNEIEVEVHHVNFVPRPPSHPPQPNPRQGRVTPPIDKPSENRAPRAVRARYRKPLIIW